MIGARSADLKAALAALRAGEAVAIPTETVYGLAADAENPAAVRRVFALKGRPADHPLIVHLGEAAWLERYVCGIPEAAWRLARALLARSAHLGAAPPPADPGGRDRRAGHRGAARS
ncbi:MAG: Sua5/YciO/YrdC/YwlC family protein [Xanthomonadales bacterium]|nr:Sua5/YciO/YrdC/YwlC family protein [Xanthomonadales bacterium]